MSKNKKEDSLNKSIEEIEEKFDTFTRRHQQKLLAEKLRRKVLEKHKNKFRKIV